VSATLPADLPPDAGVPWTAGWGLADAFAVAGEAAVAWSRAANGSESLLCVVIDVCSRCADETAGGALTSDTVLDTANPLRTI